MATYMVARELGHTNVEEIRRTYDHLSRQRVRLPEGRYLEADVVDIAGAKEETA